MSEEQAKTASKVRHAGDEVSSPERATTEPVSEHSGPDHPAAEKGTEQATSEMSVKDAGSADPIGSEIRPKNGSRTLSAEHTEPEIGAGKADGKPNAKQSSRTPNVEGSATEGSAKHASGKPSTEHAGPESDAKRRGAASTAQRAATKATAKPPAKGSKAKPAALKHGSKADDGCQASGGVEQQLAAPVDARPGHAGKIIEIAAFAIIVVIVVMIGAAMFNATRGKKLRETRPQGADDPLSTSIYRGRRSWHGYGPQILVCTLGERRNVTSPESLPPDGLCDVVLYVHVMTLGSEFDDGASDNLQALWTRAAKDVKTRYGYSFSESLLPIADQRALESFVLKAANDKRIRAFGMLDARWARNTSNDSYTRFVEALNSTSMQLPEDRRAALVFGYRVDPDTSTRGVEFWNSHAAILERVHVLVYQGHVELSPQSSSSNVNCMVRFPSPRFEQAEDSDTTMQDGVAAIDTALHYGKAPLATDICVSITLSGLRFYLSEDSTEEDKKPGAECVSAAVVSYADVCPSNGTLSTAVPKALNATSGVVVTEHTSTTKFAGEGALVTREKDVVLDTFDDSETLAQKLRTAKLALSLSAQPYWSFCLAAFNVEHEDSDGICGNSFERLTVARNFLHGKLRWHEE